MTTRVDRRVLFGLLALLGLGLSLGLGYMMAKSPSAPGGQPAQQSSSLPTLPSAAGAASQSAADFATVDPNVAGQQATEEAAEAALPRIQIADAVAKLGQLDVLFVDARSQAEFNTAHIKGAVSLPVDEVEARLSELPKDKEIVFYCA